MEISASALSSVTIHVSHLFLQTSPTLATDSFPFREKILASVVFSCSKSSSTSRFILHHVTGFAFALCQRAAPNYANFTKSAQEEGERTITNLVTRVFYITVRFLASFIRTYTCSFVDSSNTPATYTAYRVTLHSRGKMDCLRGLIASCSLLCLSQAMHVLGRHRVRV